MDLVVRELKRTAGIEEVQTLKKYVEFWNPMNFVTQRDLDKAIESKLHLVKASLRKTTRKKRSYVKKKKKHK
jgi:hypothetical protein